MQVILAHRADTRLESVEVSQNYLTVFARTSGLQVPAQLVAILYPKSNPLLITSSSHCESRRTQPPVWGTCCIVSCTATIVMSQCIVTPSSHRAGWLGPVLLSLENLQSPGGQQHSTTLHAIACSMQLCIRCQRGALRRPSFLMEWISNLTSRRIRSAQEARVPSGVTSCVSCTAA